MRRSEIEARVQSLVRDARLRVVEAPLRMFLFGVLLGVVIAEFSRVLVPLIVVFLLVALGLWFFAEDDLPPST